MVRLVKGKFVAKVRMGGELGGAPRFRPQRPRGVRGACPRFRPWHTKGGPGGLPPGLGHRVQGGSGGLAPRFRPQRLELTHFVTGSVNFFVVFHAFRNLYTPPKTPFFPTGPLACWWLSGVFPIILLILEHQTMRVLLIFWVLS